MEATGNAGAAPLAAPTITDPVYLREVFDDEVKLAGLLRWGNVEVPTTLTCNAWLWGTHGGERGLAARLAKTFLPRWRRCWSSAGELVALCGLNILQGRESVSVTARSGPAVVANFADHPSQDAAIRAAMCKVAIAYLSAERAGQGVQSSGEPELVAEGA
jgi:hypothetical protein